MYCRGYDNISSGIAGSLLLGTGFVGATARDIFKFIYYVFIS